MTYYRTIRLADTDAAGVVYFAQLLSICHEAYETALEEVGSELRHFLGDSAIALPIVHAEIDFFRPLFCGDKIAVDLFPQPVSESEFELAYQISAALASPSCLAKARTRHTCIELASRRRISLPPPILSWLELAKMC